MTAVLLLAIYISLVKIIQTVILFSENGLFVCFMNLEGIQINSGYYLISLTYKYFSIPIYYVILSKYYLSI